MKKKIFIYLFFFFLFLYMRNCTITKFKNFILKHDQTDDHLGEGNTIPHLDSKK